MGIMATKAMAIRMETWGRGVGQQRLDILYHAVEQRLDAEHPAVGDVVLGVGPVVPVAKAREQPHSHQDGFGQGHGDAQEDVGIAGAVDFGGFIQLIRDAGAHVGADQDDVEGAQQEIGEDVGCQGVADAKPGGPHDVRGHQTSGEQHGEEHKKAEEPAGGQVFQGKGKCHQGR